ncbi:hypothetical protein V8E36_008918 [Tilletia maclaganii]
MLKGAAGLAAGLAKLTLDVGAELAKDEDVRKMSKKFYKSIKPGDAQGAEHGNQQGSGKAGNKRVASGSNSQPRKFDRSASTSRTYANQGSRARRPSMPHRSSNESPGSGRSSPTGTGRVKRAASYAHPQYLQPGMPAGYEYVMADPNTGYGSPCDNGLHGRSASTSKSAGASPLASPRLSAASPAYPPQHRAVIEARAGHSGYGSDGYGHNSSGGRAAYQPSSRLSRSQILSSEYDPQHQPRQSSSNATAGRGRERSNSAGDAHDAQITAVGPALYGGYFAHQAGGRASGSPIFENYHAPISIPAHSGVETNRLPAPPNTPPIQSAAENSSSKATASPFFSPSHHHSSAGTKAAATQHHGTHIVVPPDGTTGGSALSSAVSTPTLSTAGAQDPFDGLRKKDSPHRSHHHQHHSKSAGGGGSGSAPLTPSQSYDALASSRKRIGAGVPMADVTFAARCSTLIYSLFDLQDTRDWLDSGKDKLERNPTLLDVVFSDPGKGIKNWALFKRKSDGTLIISVRGTSRGPDWVDDMLCHLKEKDFALEKASTLRCGDGSVFHAHSSFLRCALAMVPEVCRLLSKRLKSAAARAPGVGGGHTTGTPAEGGGGAAGGALSILSSPLGTPGSEASSRSRRGGGVGGAPSKLIITGHSAGGAVASLIYLLLEHHYSHLLAKFSQVFCITFGSAACVRRTRPLTTRPSDQVLAFILRGDPVPRLDMNYGLYLLDHYARLPSARSGGGGGSSGNKAAPAGLVGEASATTTSTTAATAADPFHSGPGHARAKQTSARDLDGETFLSRLTQLYGSERESERQASSDGTLEVPLQDLFPAGEMLMIDVGKADVWEVDAEKLEATSPVDVERHEMSVYQRTLLGIEKAQPRLVID